MIGLAFLAGALASAAVAWLLVRVARRNAADPSRQSGFITRHWRGELPLRVSYWIVYVLGSAVTFAFTYFFTDVLGEFGPDGPVYAFVEMTIVWGIVLSFSTWQLVGTWRSAERYKKGWRVDGFGNGWGTLAQIALIPGWLKIMAIVLGNTAPQLAELARVAFLGDPDIPGYSIRVMRDGTEMEIIGGIKFGLTDDVSKALAASPGVRVVHLDSPGGRAGEAEALNSLIRERGLITYVTADCYSACVVAFAAGRERWLSRHGHLGFHRGAMDGVPDDGTDDRQAGILLRAGFDPAFVRAAIATPNDDIWKPERQELIAAGVITGVDDGDRFAASGYGDAGSREAIVTGLASGHPLFAAIERLQPDLHQTILARLYDGYRAGDTEGMLIRKLRAELQPVVATNRGRADDTTLFALAVMTAEQYELLAEREPALCWPFYFDWDGGSRAPEHFPVRMLIRELGLFERVLATAEPRPDVPAKTRAQLWQRVRKQLAARLKPDALGLLKKTVLPIGHQAEYCTAVAAMLRELAHIGGGDAAFALRDLMSP